jgi:hypothetical protein
MIKLLPFHGKVMGLSWKQPLTKMQKKIVYVRPKVVRLFSKPDASGSYVHWAALYSIIARLTSAINNLC